MTILITGGLGYIGSHTVIELVEQGQECVIIDDLSMTTIEVLYRIELILGKKIPFVKLNLLEKKDLRNVFIEYDITSVIHFAGYKSVSESVMYPLTYYQNNIIGTLNLLDVMKEFSVKKLVFSSSATVYGDINVPPLKETIPLKALNPYGRTKLMIEEILEDLSESESDWSIAILRYFNPIGAHKSGLLGELPQGAPNNLMPHILRTANKETENLLIFGCDYSTADGSCIRDFVHIIDLANGHIKALNYINRNICCEAINLGTGIGYSVLDLISTFEEVNSVKIPYIIVGRREGDIAESIADATKAKKLLNWQAKYNLKDMCQDAWKWYRNSNSLYKVH